MKGHGEFSINYYNYKTSTVKELKMQGYDTWFRFVNNLLKFDHVVSRVVCQYKQPACVSTCQSPA